MDAVAALLAREAATAVVIAYAGALDARDWAAYRLLFEDQVAIDYGAIGSFVGEIAADAWTARCRALEGFDATAHRISNATVRIDSDAAIVDSIVDAVHFIRRDGKALSGDLIGRYTHVLRQRDHQWRIAGVRLDVVGYPAGRAAFDAAFAAARERTGAIA